jgi:signal transduction histidine kinase
VRRPGLQADLLFSLALVMVLATAVLAAVLVTHGETRLRDVLGRALLVEAHASGPHTRLTIPGTQWWIVTASGSVSSRGTGGRPIDAETRALATRAREADEALLQPGVLWDTVRFAAPVDSRGSVAVARVPREASLRLRAAPFWAAVGVLVADIAIFTAFGMSLLRRRLVRPLQTLLGAARAIAAGDLGARVPVQGPRETAELGDAFNAMTAALEQRTGEMEKAVVELRAANADLRQARAGLDRAERLASVGRLAAGVAHEVGNPIAAMLAFLDLVARDPQLGASSHEHLRRAAREGERVRRILRQLLDFSRPAKGVPGPVDLVAMARETVALVSAQRRGRGADPAQPGAQCRGCRTRIQGRAGGAARESGTPGGSRRGVSGPGARTQTARSRGVPGLR